MKFKHFYDAGLQGTGTYKFRHYSQQEPSSGETWVLNETLSEDDLEGSNGDYYFAVSFTCNGSNYTGLRRFYNPKSFYDYLYYHIGTGSEYLVAYSESWQNTAYRTITFDESVTDSTLLTWLQANGVKQ